jgi:hypothetical protein
MVSSGYMPPPTKKIPKKTLATRPPRPEVKIKKPFERFRLEIYGSAILTILLVVLPLTWYVKCVLLAAIAAMMGDIAWNSPQTIYWSPRRKLRRWGSAVVVLVLVAWVSIHKQYRDDTRQRLREPMAQILATGSKMQDACLSGNSEEAETAATAWGGETGKWLTDNLGSAEAIRFNNPAGQILPGSRYNPVQQRCWSYVSLRMIVLKDIANGIEY